MSTSVGVRVFVLSSASLAQETKLVGSDRSDLSEEEPADDETDGRRSAKELLRLLSGVPGVEDCCFVAMLTSSAVSFSDGMGDGVEAPVEREDKFR